MLDVDDSLLEFHDEISEPLSLTVSELKLFFLSDFPSLFTFGLGVVGGLSCVVGILTDPQAWALPVQPLCISVLSGAIVDTTNGTEEDLNDFSNDF